MNEFRDLMRQLLSWVVFALPPCIAFGQLLQGRVLDDQNKIIVGAHVQIMKSGNFGLTNYPGERKEPL